MFPRVGSEVGSLVEVVPVMEMKFVEISEVEGVGLPPDALKKNSDVRRDLHHGSCCVSTLFQGFAGVAPLSEVGMLGVSYQRWKYASKAGIQAGYIGRYGTRAVDRMGCA